MLLSIVVPAYNEEGNLRPLYDRIVPAMVSTGYDWELIVVDDGSVDGTVDAIRVLHAADPRVKGVLLSRNFGHEIASTAGLDAARGDAIVLIDADLQDPPEMIPDLVAKWKEGYDIVSAQRTFREGEALLKRASAYLFYRLLYFLVDWRLPLDTGDFRLISRVALDAFLECRERNRFVRALVAWAGFRQTVVPFDRAPRYAGKTKYNFWRQFGLAVTAVTSFSVSPLRVAIWAGVAMLSIGLLGGLVAVAATLSGGAMAHAFLFVSLWLIGGVQCILIGIAGEYIGRIHVESQRRPLYFVREYLGELGAPPDERKFR